MCVCVCVCCDSETNSGSRDRQTDRVTSVEESAAVVELLSSIHEIFRSDECSWETVSCWDKEEVEGLNCEGEWPGGVEEFL